MLRAVLVEEKRRRMQIPVKATLEYYCPSCKNRKSQWQILQYIAPIKTIYDEMVLKCLTYLYNKQIK